jgi:hypothetical protein
MLYLGTDGLWHLVEVKTSACDTAKATVQLLRMEIAIREQGAYFRDSDTMKRGGVVFQDMSEVSSALGLSHIMTQKLVPDTYTVPARIRRHFMTAIHLASRDPLDAATFIFPHLEKLRKKYGDVPLYPDLARKYALAHGLVIQYI